LIMKGTVNVDGQNVLRAEFVVTMASLGDPISNEPTMRSLA